MGFEHLTVGSAKSASPDRRKSFTAKFLRFIARKCSTAQARVAVACIAIVAAICVGALLGNDTGHAQSGGRITSPAAGAVMRGGAPMQLSFTGGVAAKIEYSPNGTRWQSVEGKGPSPVSIMLPREDSSRAQLRVTLETGAVIQSSPFAVDGTAPITRNRGDPMVVGAIRKIFLPFAVYGHDVKNVRLQLKDASGAMRETRALTPDEAKRSGFDAPEVDGMYDLTLIAEDYAGNMETKAAPDWPDVRVDTTRPVVTLSVDLKPRYAFGGQDVSVTWSAEDSNLDESGLIFEYVTGKGAISLDARGKPLPLKVTGRSGTFKWTLPHEDHSSVALMFSARDASGNVARAQSETFSLFGQKPQAVIAGEKAEGDNRVKFTMDYIHAAALLEAVPNYTLWIYEGRWDGGKGRFVWDTANPYRESEFVNDLSRTELYVPTTTANKAFCARLIAGDPKGELSEPEPDENAEPESVFLPATAGTSGFAPLPRAMLEDLDEYKRAVRGGEAVELKFKLPLDWWVGMQVTLDWSDDGGRTWHSITAQPIGSNDAAHIDTQAGTGHYSWTPAGDIRYATIRAVSQITRGGVSYRVQDLMAGGIIVDTVAPTDARILRVSDQLGRPLRSGDYTNSHLLVVEWTARDEGPSGLAHGVLWDNCDKTFADAAPARAWNDRNFQPGSNSHSMDAGDAGQRRLNPLEPHYSLNLVKDPPRPMGTLGLILEGVDYAGNGRYRMKAPADDARPDFEVNVDFLPPRVMLTEKPTVLQVRAGDNITIKWRADDMMPPPRIRDSMGPDPVTIYILDDSGRRYIVDETFTGLPAEGQLTFPVPALAGARFKVLVSAMDRAGNESGESDGDPVVSFELRKPTAPRVRLTSMEKMISTRSITFAWQPDADSVPVADLESVTLWVSKDGGARWTLERSYMADEFGRVQTPMPAADGQYAWSLSARSLDGLEEPEPTSPADAEQSLMEDNSPPMLELAMDPSRSTFVVDEPSPTVKFRVTDLNFAQERVTLEISRDGRMLPVKTPDVLKNGEWAGIRHGIEAPGMYRVTLQATDAKGNQASREMTFEVKTTGAWEIIGLMGSGPYYCKTERYLFWRNHGAVPQDSKVDLCLQWMQGEQVMDEMPIAMQISDNGKYLVAFPEQPGTYRFRLTAVDVKGQEQKADSATLTVSIPVVTALVDPVPAEPIDGLVEYPTNIVVMYDGSRDVQLPAERIALYYRYFGPNATAAQPGWLMQECLPRWAPSSMDPMREIGSYRVSFVPVMGEGRYEVVPWVRDVYGYASPTVLSTTAPQTELVFDAGPPQVTLTAPGKAALYYRAKDVKELHFTASDSTLVKPSLRVDVLPEGDHEWLEALWPIVTTGETATNVIGKIYPIFPDARRYRIRVVAKDELGQIGIGELNAELCGGMGEYVACHPVESEGSMEQYCGEHSSRRADFRVAVKAVHPWGDGVKSLTLWWRMAGATGAYREWTAIRHENLAIQGVCDSIVVTLPFKAPESGMYEFIVTSESASGQKEMIEQPMADDMAELQVWVSADGYSLSVSALKESDVTTGSQKVALGNGRIQQGGVYLLEWTVASGIAAHTSEFTLDFSADNGKTLASPAMPMKSESGKPELGGYSVSTRRVYEGGRYSQVRTYRCLWECPFDLPDNEAAAAFVKVTVNERSDAMPAFSRVATSPRYMVGEPRIKTMDAAGGEVIYYRGKIRDGKAAFEAKQYKEAIEHFYAAQKEFDTNEVNRWLADAFDKMGDALKANHHRARAPMAPDEAPPDVSKK